MVSLHQQKQRLSARLQTAFQREHIWHTLWLILTWACLIYACLRTWQVIQGRMYYLLDSDMSSDLLLSYRLRQEHALLTTNWFYSTELRIFHNHLVFAPLFFLSDNWLQVRTIGTAIILLGMLASCWYFCRQAGIGHLFPAIGTLLVTPVSDVYFRITLLTVSYPPHLFAAFLCCGVLFQYIRCKKRPVRIALLVFLTLFSFVIGLGGLRLRLLCAAARPHLAGAGRAGTQAADRQSAGNCRHTGRLAGQHAGIALHIPLFQPGRHPLHGL